jgi:hypothetical protein
VDYDNMLACYPASWPKGPKHECGFGARERENRRLSISPLEPRCETSFHYFASGKVEGRDADAEGAINVLKLNHKQLQGLRAAAFQGRGLSLSPDDPYGDGELLSAPEASRLADDILQPIDGMLAEFCVAIAQVAVEYARALDASG